MKAPPTCAWRGALLAGLVAALVVAGSTPRAESPRQVVAQNLSDDPTSLLVDGLTAAATGQYEEAMQRLKAALAAGVEPTPELLYWLGMSQVNSGEVDRGLENLETSTAGGDPARIRHARLLAGEAHRKRDDCKRAVPKFLAVRDSDPTFREPETLTALTYLADCYLRLGRFDAAEVTARMAETLFREDGNQSEQGFATRVRAFAVLGLGDAAEALRLLRQIEPLNPDYAVETDLPAFFAALGEPGKAFDALGLQGYMGATLSSPEEGGARIDALTAGGPAVQAGLAVGDRIIAVNGRALPDAAALSRGVGRAGPGARLAFAVDRGGQTARLVVTLGSWFHLGDLHRQVPALVRWHVSRNRAVASAERAEGEGDIHSAFLIYRELAESQPPDSGVLRRLIRLSGAVSPRPLVPLEVHAMSRAAIERFAATPAPAAADAAIQGMEHVVRRAPWWSDAHFNLALMHAARGNPGIAAVHFRLFLEADPQAPERADVLARITALEAKVRDPRG